MAQATPLQIVKEKFGSKDKLVDALTALLEPQDGESKEDHTLRLKRVANAKLLHLHSVGEEVKGLGGKDALVKKVAELHGHSKDKDYVSAISQASISNLLDQYKAGTRRNAAKAAKKA